MAAYITFEGCQKGLDIYAARFVHLCMIIQSKVSISLSEEPTACHFGVRLWSPQHDTAFLIRSGLPSDDPCGHSARLPRSFIFPQMSRLDLRPLVSPGLISHGLAMGRKRDRFAGLGRAGLMQEDTHAGPQYGWGPQGPLCHQAEQK